MQDAGFVPPDAVPDELVAMYGPRARRAVRYRRTRRYRLGRRVDRVLRGRDLFFFTASALLWGVILSAFGTVLVLAVAHWPRVMLYVVVSVASASLSAVLTSIAFRRRAGQA